MSSRIKAVIDVGTNSVKLLVAKVHGSSILPLKETSIQTRLGKNFYKTKHLHSDAIARTVDGIRRFVDLAKEFEAQSIEIIATSAAREAVNVGDLIAAVDQATGLGLKVISGDEEAALVFRGVSSGVQEFDGDLLILDVGGGSTEMIFGSGEQERIHHSVPLGTVRLMERFPLSNPPSKQELKACQKYISTIVMDQLLPKFNEVIRQSRNLRLVGTGGTTTLLAMIYRRLTTYDRDAIQSTVLKRADLDELVQRLWSISETERKKIVGLPPEKADVILLGSSIYQCILQEVPVSELFISMRGLRFGSLIVD